MVYLGIATFDIDVSKNRPTLIDALEQLMNIEAIVGYPGIPESDQTPNRHKSGATTRTNIIAHRKYSRINDTQTRTTTSLVYQMLHRRKFGERVSMDEGNGTSSESDGILTRTHRRSCENIREFNIPYANPVSCFSK
jgi:hypothetical protein